MKWIGRRESGNIEDRRSSGGGLAVGGGLTAVIALIFSLLTGQNPLELIGMAQSGNQSSQQEAPLNTERQADEKGHFVAVVLADTEDVWNKLFESSGNQYQEPALVLFNGSVSSACDSASSAAGPFYCPGDSKVYIDLSFYDELQSKFQAPGDFAMAYVVAHEVGHHIQHLTGTSDKVDQMRGKVSKEEYNQLSVRLELQADFLAAFGLIMLKK